jgi:hypothetical protein
MDKRTKISFIPQKPLIKRERSRVLSVNLFLFFSSFLFFVTLAAYAGLYFYNINLEKTLVEKKEELALEKEKIDPKDIIKESQELQTRIINAKKLISEHIIISPIFGFLEEITLKSISFDSLSFTKEAEGGSLRAAPTPTSPLAPQKTTGLGVVEITGQAPNYASLAYQSDVLKEEMKKGDKIKKFSISNMSLDESGNILFNLKISFNLPFLSYKEMFKEKTTPDITEESNNTGEQSGIKENDSNTSDIVGVSEKSGDIDDLVSLF